MKNKDSRKGRGKFHCGFVICCLRTYITSIGRVELLYLVWICFTVPRGLVAEKKDEQLFFVQSEAVDTEGSVRISRAQRRKRPLRSHANLRRDPLISDSHSLTASAAGRTGNVTQGVSEELSEKERKGRKLWSQLNRVTDSSEDEQEYDVSSRFAVKRRKEERELAKAICKRLDKSRLKGVTRDLWADGGDGMDRDSNMPTFWCSCVSR